MDLVLLSPAGLAGLGALLIPILIHLFSRSRGRRVWIGQIALVRGLSQRRVSEVRLSQWLLLLLRLLLIVLATLVLAQLARPGLATLAGTIRYVTPAWLAAADPDERAAISGSGDTASYLLAPGFPQLADAAANGNAVPELGTNADGEQIPSTWALLAERLDTTLHTGTVNVYSSGRTSEFGAWLPELPAAVDWQLAEPQTAGSAGYTAGNSEPLRVLLWHADHRGDEAALLVRALTVLREQRLGGLEWSLRSGAPGVDVDLAGFELVLWLQDIPPPATSGSAGAATVPATAVPIIDVTQLLQAGASLELPARLLDAMAEGRGMPRWNQARVDTGPWQSVATPTDPGQAPHRPLQTWLVLLLILLWGLERWLSERRSHA